MDISTLKEKLGDEYAALESYIHDLTGQRDAARKESVEGRKALKAKAEMAEAATRTLMEKLGIETLEELDALPPAKGQAEALKQLETRLKAKDAALAEKDAALAGLTARHRDALRDREMEKALAAYDFIDRDLVADHVRQQLDWQDDQWMFKTDKGEVALAEGVKQLAAAKPHILKPNGARGSGYNPNARGGGVKAFAEMTLTERTDLYRRDAAEYERQAAAHPET